jgi:hypothetical protein
LLIKKELNLLYLIVNKLVSFIILVISFIDIYKIYFIKSINQRLKLIIKDFISFLLTVEVITISSREAKPFLIKDPLTNNIRKI